MSELPMFPALPDHDGATFEMAAVGAQTAPFNPQWTGPQRTLSVVTVTETAPPPPPPAPPAPYFPATPSLPLERLHVVWDSFGDTRLGIQGCAGCKAVYADDSLRDADDIIEATRRSAGRAGWFEDGHKVFRCPDCHAKHLEDLNSRPELPATGPGAAQYEANLAAHIECLAEIDTYTHSKGYPAPGSTLDDEVRLRVDDLAHHRGIGEEEAFAHALAVVAERRAPETRPAA